MSVSLYDLLDVDEGATADEIRAAWRNAIVDLDPTDRRFRAYNEAATVLLDEKRRAAYDDELAAARSTEVEEPAEAEEPTEVEEPEEPAEPTEADEPVEVEEPAAGPAAKPAKPAKPAADSAAAGPPTWSLYAAAAVAVVSVALLCVVLWWPGSVGGPAPADKAEAASDAARTVEDAAAQAVPVVLSYDYRTFDEDVREAESHLTEEFAADRADLLTQLRSEVVREKVVVTAVVSGTALTRVSEDGKRAVVVAFVEQDSQKGDSAPRIRETWASLSMVSEDGTWLIDDICTQEDCA